MRVTPSQAQAALEDILRLGAGLTPVSWPNKPFSDSPPYYAFNVATRLVRNDNLNPSSGAYLTGSISIHSVCELGYLTKSVDKMAEDLIGLFPAGLRISAGTGQITLMMPPDIREGYPDKNLWRVPTLISFITN